MTKNKMAVLAIAGLTVLGGASGAFASPGGNGKGLRVGQCTLSADQLQTADTSPRLEQLQTRLDARVAAGKMTQEKADAKFAEAQQRVSLQELLREARRAPVLELLGMTEDELKTARQEGTTLRDILDQKGITPDQLREAMRSGAAAAKTLMGEVCTVASPAARRGKAHGRRRALARRKAMALKAKREAASKKCDDSTTNDSTTNNSTTDDSTTDDSTTDPNAGNGSTTL
ncbi:MAG: hypothetical protein KDC36_09305 [Thermoleophilia bacterium]|nr:hypothetical protein [Thermoleophilia bacterium]